METIRFFSESPIMQGLRGDSFPLFRIGITEYAGSVDDWVMRVVLERKDVPGSIALTKECNYVSDEDGEGFTVRFYSSETADLCGSYTMHFILTDGYGKEYRKLIGTLEVFDSPREVT